MDPTPNLKQDLSMMLDAELKKQLAPGESVEISLPGSFGEALAVTNRRAIVIRDCEGGVNAKCGVHSYPLAMVKGAEATSSGMGGYIELKLSQTPDNQDAARVYFPSYDMAKFKAAAERIGSAALSQAAPEAPAASAQSPAAVPASAAEQATCPNCDARVDAEAVFCGQCGMQIRARCATCGGSSPMGSAFCESCGVKFEEFHTECHKCGTRVSRWQTYCTECGSILQQACAACGASVIDSWKYCPNCGRQLGSRSIDMRSNFARRLRERAATETDQGEPAAQSTSTIMGSTPTVERPPAPTPQPAAAAPAQQAAPAEQHNQRGRQLFDDGDLEGAIREFQSAVSLEPRNASFHCNLAIAYDENGQDDEALAEYERTLQLDPNDLTALLSLGYMYNENDQPDKAEEVWNRILEVAPHSAEAQEVQENLRHQEEL